MTLHRLLRKQLALILPWLLLVLATALVASQVKRPSALVSVWIPWAETGTLAMAMTAVILAGGIDLSIGAIVALCAMVEGLLFSRFGWHMGWAASAAVATGIACGCANGALVAAGLSPLVATLATMAIYSGLAMTISGAERITDFPDWFLGWSQIAGVPSQFWLLLVVFTGMYVLIHHTRFGRQCYAIGDNRLAAEFAAIPVRRAEWRLYTLSGFVAAVVAVLYTMVRDAATPDAHRGVELQAIACVVVGGTSITGGRGSVMRTLLGLAVVANLDVGLAFLGTRFDMVSAESRLVMTGVLLIVVAVWNERAAAFASADRRMS
jgi:ribose/xylose/arabinose/galactoside ABC-type transport system permease subunit